MALTQRFITIWSIWLASAMTSVLEPPIRLESRIVVGRVARSSAEVSFSSKSTRNGWRLLPDCRL